MLSRRRDLDGDPAHGKDEGVDLPHDLGQDPDCYKQYVLHSLADDPTFHFTINKILVEASAFRLKYPNGEVLDKAVDLERLWGLFANIAKSRFGIDDFQISHYLESIIIGSYWYCIDYINGDLNQCAKIAEAYFAGAIINSVTSLSR